MAPNHKLSGVQRSREYNAYWGEQPVTRIGLEMTQMIALVDKDIVTVTTISYVQNLDERLSILNREKIQN